jgi:predicted nuclease with RNAse H fold
MADRGVWVGVDVGAAVKGFHVAAVDGHQVVERPQRCPTVRDVVDLLAGWRPRLAAIDSPCAPAPDGERSRACERLFARAGICGIRFTPDRGRLADDPYYAWVRHGLSLYDALRAAGVPVIECFPTAAWTVWHGARGTVPRAAWSAAALRRLGLTGAGGRLGQDERDAIGAAMTAYQHDMGETERFGDIVVPAREAGTGERRR